MVKLLIVDDHHLVRAAVSKMLADEEWIEIAGEAGSGEDAVTMARDLLPDVVLMDIKMQGIGGLEATRKIVRMLPDCKVIALSALVEETFATRALEVGASGYLSKGADPVEMVNAIRQVHHGQRYLSSEIAQKVALGRMTPGNENPFDNLSDRELQIALMVVNCQKVCDISDKLFLSPKTVNTYRYRIFDKLQVSSDVELTHLAIRHKMIDTESL
ncbi:UvrY/SirA/GacA family response regulator transcription factor [Oceanospirillum linum]|uniref:Two-component system response regulator UvrY n=1 Tax=Oceanospirillum linum TaxID=966 RepID=A0A1T1HAM0_OCELI|nr:UvrY/SirA/GacA family response regulator transcription factor [Oceanospirillum linum]OOV86790.1 two-component system response regulator UvrY [Oceanospirillum linum]SEG22414.1 DNA-binding response regulator, NarL/FixJ family, contains REC and HTH domains [Oleiphilus messinensis]SMP25308.1 two component transcriptional regulator, LuxR family [Oceanospirillum linum]